MIEKIALLKSRKKYSSFEEFPTWLLCFYAGICFFTTLYFSVILLGVKSEYAQNFISKEIVNAGSSFWLLSFLLLIVLGLSFFFKFFTEKIVKILVNRKF
ncbi:MAG: hypothetical protein JXR63_11675 [Spirochaetales bacterium]|nr:hypothetical protein [Spirochaetales bacterium]